MNSPPIRIGIIRSENRKILGLTFGGKLRFCRPTDRRGGRSATLKFPHMISATQLRPGMVVKWNGELFSIFKMEHRTPGNLRGFVQVKMRKLSSGTMMEHRFSSEDKVERASLDQQDMEYLYDDGEFYYFMNTETFEQMHLTRDFLGDATNFLIPNLKVEIEFYEGKPMGIELPPTVDLTVVETEPGLKGATVSNVTKPAKTETGLVVQVPPFISEGEKIRVSTSEIGLPGTGVASSFLLSARLRVRFVVHRHQIRQRHLRVFLRGRQARVAQQFLNGAQIGAVGEQMRREGVAQAVRMQRRVARNHARVELDDFARAAVGQPRAAVIHQQRALARLGGALRQIFFERRRRFLSIRHLALLAALAAHANPALAQIEVVEIEPHQFADAQAAAVQQLEQRDVALGMRPLELVLRRRHRPAYWSVRRSARWARAWALWESATARATFVGTDFSRNRN